jgi:ADP-ribose diphosphatase
MKKIISENKIFKVAEISMTVRDRKVKMYAVIEPNTVAILPITKKGRILLERQYRAAIGRTIYEIPAGHIEKNETPLIAAKRELEAETGFRPGRLRFLIYFYPTPGIESKKEHLYLAENLVKGKRSLDVDERIAIEEMGIEKALKSIKSGRIVDAKTILAILYYKKYLYQK